MNVDDTLNKKYFKNHAKVADITSDTLMNYLGVKKYRHTSYIDLGSLLSNAPVEITLVCKVK